jgi:polyisoprenoid-binding protein YceI
MARGSRSAFRWVIAAVLLALVIGVLAPFIYINFVSDDAPDRLDVSTATTAPEEAATAPTDGTWTASTGSTAGYRVQEILFGQDNVAAGRTSDVTGELTIAGTQVETANLTVDLTSVSSGESRRDNQFQGRIMDTATFPNATFELTQPIELETIPDPNLEITATATGDLTLHGTTMPVTFDVKAKRTGNTIQVSGTIPITFADWGIPNPSFGPISTEDHGELEFLVVFAKAGAS